MSDTGFDLHTSAEEVALWLRAHMGLFSFLEQSEKRIVLLFYGDGAMLAPASIEFIALSLRLSVYGVEKKLVRSLVFLAVRARMGLGHTLPPCMDQFTTEKRRETAVTKKDIARWLAEHLDLLNGLLPRDRDIVMGYYFRGEVMRVIAKQYEVKHQCIFKILNRAVDHVVARAMARNIRDIPRALRYRVNAMVLDERMKSTQ